jgi:hypothetical protein
MLWSRSRLADGWLRMHCTVDSPLLKAKMHISLPQVGQVGGRASQMRAKQHR